MNFHAQNSNYFDWESITFLWTTESFVTNSMCSSWLNIQTFQRENEFTKTIMDIRIPGGDSIMDMRGVLVETFGG